jgi:hypothetical protein
MLKSLNRTTSIADFPNAEWNWVPDGTLYRIHQCTEFAEFNFGVLYLGKIIYIRYLWSIYFPTLITSLSG